MDELQKLREYIIGKNKISKYSRHLDAGKNMVKVDWKIPLTLEFNRLIFK